MTEEKEKISESSMNNENLQKLKNLLNNDKSNLFDILALKQKVKFDDKNEEIKINNDIWQRQYSLIFPPKDSQKISKPKISQLNILISSAEEYNINDNDKIKKVKMLQEKGNNYIKEISKIKNIEQLNIFKSNLESLNLDLNEYFIQREMKIKTVKDSPPEINPPSKNTQNELGNGLFLTTKEISNKIKPKKKSYKKKEDSYEADFIHDGEESEDSSLIKNIKEMNKKESSSFKRYANALQMEAENFVNSRSRRNIKKKQDDDYIYEDDMNKEGKEKDELGLNDSNDDKNDVDIVILHKRKKKENDGDEEYSEDSYDKIKEKKEQKINEKLLNKKMKRAESVKNTNNNYNNLSLNKSLSTNSEKEIKAKSRQKALTTITDLLKNNKYLMEQGLDYINSLSKKVEEDLAKAYPDIDYDYQKTLTNMTKTLKEIAKYKRINNLVIKGKIMLFKMAKFNFGEKFIQKLKKVEEGNKTNNKPVNKQKSKVEAPSLDILNNFSSETNKFQSKDTLNISKAFSGISFRSGFTQSSFNDERNNNENMNEDSLDSIDEQNNIKFSPGGNNHPNRDASGNIEQILEHTYDPFNSEKINSSNLLFPILYDPSLTMDEDSISEDHISNQDNEENNNIEITEPPHKGSVLRLYHGKIKLNHNVIDKVSLYSFNKYEKFLKFPSFEKELILTSKAKSNEVIPYCLKQIKNNSKTCLYGWIEPEPNKNNKNIEANKFSELIDEFERNEKCSCLVENKIKLYIFTLSEKDQKLYNKIIKKEKFINKRFMESLNSDNKFLVFVLLANNDDLENDVIKNKKKMSPEIITQLDFSEDEDDEENLTLNKKSKNLSIVMEEEEENLPNSSLKQNNSNENKDQENYNNNNDNNNKNDDDEESLIDKEENEKLKIILEQNDFNTINEYIENNFKDLPLEEMATKLQRFTSENREKLLNSIKEYSEHFAQNDNNQMDVENDNNNNNNNMNQMQTMNNMGMINPNYGINMYQNESGINQMYMGGINNMNNMQQQQNSNNVNNMNPNLQQMYYNQGMNIYNNYNQNFK